MNQYHDKGLAFKIDLRAIYGLLNGYFILN